jgi:hypothetical protein
LRFTSHKWTVHHEQWIYVRGDRALDIVVLSWGQDVVTLHGRASAGGDGEEGSLDKEAIPKHAVVGQRELQQWDRILVVRLDAVSLCTG